VDASVVGAYAAEVVAQAVVRAVLAAEPVGGLPAARDFAGSGVGGNHVPQGQ